MRNKGKNGIAQLMWVCSRRIAKSGGKGVDLAIHAELTHAMWEILGKNPLIS